MSINLEEFKNVGSKIGGIGGIEKSGIVEVVEKNEVEVKILYVVGLDDEKRVLKMSEVIRLNDNKILKNYYCLVEIKSKKVLKEKKNGGLSSVIGKNDSEYKGILSFFRKKRLEVLGENNG